MKHVNDDELTLVKDARLTLVDDGGLTHFNTPGSVVPPHQAHAGDEATRGSTLDTALR